MSKTEEWKGIAIDESFQCSTMPPAMRIVGSRSVRLAGEEDQGPVHFRAIIVKDEDISEVIHWARRTLRSGWYMHLVQGRQMRVVYQNRVFDVVADDPQSIERARQYGIQIGIHPRQLSLEKLFEDPFS